MNQLENQLGRYKVQHVKFIDGQWRPYGPWMRLIVTNQRVILFPDHAVQQAKHLVLYPQMIARVWSICLGKRDGAIMALRSGELLYFYVHWSESTKLIRDIHLMLRPAPRQPALATTARKRITN
jgi:hypothetical protein